MMIARSAAKAGRLRTRAGREDGDEAKQVAHGILSNAACGCGERQRPCFLSGVSQTRPAVEAEQMKPSRVAVLP